MASTDPGRSLTLGYWLSSEEHTSRALVEQAAAAEEAGFALAMISDHLNPWIPKQGHSPHVWTVIGAIASATDGLRVGTGVVAPGVRSHPIDIAQAAATAETLMPGRFFLGLGTGERLNEQAFGERWPRPAERRDRLHEAIDIIRRLWGGKLVSEDGDWFRVEALRLHTLPDTPPPLYVAGGGSTAALAGDVADGLIGVAPDPEAVSAYEHSGGRGPRIGQLHLCWAASDDAARRTAHAWWPQIALPPGATAELSRPEHFAELVEEIDVQRVAREVVLGPDPEPYRTAIGRFAAAGYDHVVLHQIGPDQAGFMEFCQRELLPVIE